MYQTTAALTCNGTNNLLTLLKAAGYNGPAVVTGGGTLYNSDGAVQCYVHNTDSSISPPGTKQVESLPFAGTITVAGNAVITVTAVGMIGTPVAVNVPVTVGMTDRNKALAGLNALSSDQRIADFFNLSMTDPATVRAEAKIAAANGGTMNFVITDPNGTGITTVANSTNTTAGALATTTGMPFGASPSPSTVWEISKGTDLSTVWLYTASSITINAEVRG